MKKRGFAISFQWIFAIIVGAIIFSFLIRFGYQQISLGSKSTSLEILNNLELQLDALSVSSSLDQEIDIKGEFQFDCYNIYLDKSKLSTEKIIFSPTKNKDKLKIRLKSWNYPFKITNFYYISNANFYLFNPPNLDIPKTFNIIVDPVTFSEDSVFVFFSQPSLQKLTQAQKYSSNIKIVDVINKKITFYPDKTISYIDDSFLYAAIFSKDYATYNCLQQKALEKSRLIIDLYKEKALFLQKDFPICHYENIIPALEQFKTNPALKHTIISQNDRLKQYDCPELY